MPLLLLVLAAGVGACTVQPPNRLFVAPDGSDDNPGTKARPLAGLEGARDAIRRRKAAGNLPAGGMTVLLRGGTYVLDNAFELTAEDSGTAEAPIVYRARPGEEVRLTGGREVRGFVPVTDQAVLKRLPAEARGKVLQADMKAQGITDLGELKSTGFGRSGTPALELFFQDKAMTLARWPNRGFIHITGVTDEKPRIVRGTKASYVGKFMYEGSRPARWMKEKDPWVHGYWFRDWADQRHRIVSIDIERRMITVAKPYHGYGYRVGQWFYGFNLLCELDSPGEWYVDRRTGMLYFWPPGAIEQGRPTVSIVKNLVTMTDVSHVTIRGMTLEAARGTAIVIRRGTGNRVIGCTLRNLGTWAVAIKGGADGAVIGCDIYATGDGGVSLSGGERKTLRPAGHAAENNHIHHYGRINRMYRPAVSIRGVGQRVAHNLIHDAPHQAIAFGGNDHVMEFNEIHHVCQEANDAGAIYSGRDWTMRGTVIRYNYLHHIQGFRGKGCMGIYLDDMYCGTKIYGNVFHRVRRAAFIGGGRDCTIENNIFVDCKPAVHVDHRALGWASKAVGGVMKRRLDAMPYQSPLWRKRYPKLVNIWEDEPAVPKRNLVARNVCKGGRWAGLYRLAKPHVTLQDNLTDRDPKFVDPAAGNFQLQDDSPAYKLGFQRIPIERIGPYKDPRRASWPVKQPPQ